MEKQWDGSTGQRELRKLPALQQALLLPSWHLCPQTWLGTESEMLEGL